MIRLITYLVLILLFATGCKNKPSNEAHHDMNMMEGMNMGNMKHDTNAIDSSLLGVVKSVNEVVISNQETVKPTVKEFGNSITADGYITFDERRNNKVSARFSGRIEKLYVKYDYQYIRKGEVIMEVYSPEIITIEEEYLQNLKNTSDTALIQKTKKKLLLLGISEDEIAKVEKDKKPSNAVSVYSPYEGYIMLSSDEVMVNNTTPKQDEMSMGTGMPASMPQSGTSTQPIKEGSYVNEGQILFMVNDFKEVWAIIAFNPKDETHIKVDMPVTLTSSLTDEVVNANIGFIEPFYSEGQKFTQARIYLKNAKQQYKVNSTVYAEVADRAKGICVPTSAILDLGERQIVWVKTGKNRFEARRVFIGQETDDFTEILSGVTEKDEIAKDAGYMVDSESLVNVNIK